MSAGDSAAGCAGSIGATAEAAAAGPAAATPAVVGAGAVAAGDSAGALFPPQAANVNKPKHAEKSARPFMRTTSRAVPGKWQDVRANGAPASALVSDGRGGS